MRHELLAIDDAELHLFVVRKIAAQAGFETTAASSIGEAARLLRERTFDCITLDLSLGEESGIAILRMLTEMDCRTPVIVVSGADDKTCEEIMLVGDFLEINLRAPVPKPIQVAVLRNALMQIAAETSVRPAASSESC